VRESTEVVLGVCRGLKYTFQNRQQGWRPWVMNEHWCAVYVSRS
jgi:hypothetical protein